MLTDKTFLNKTCVQLNVQHFNAHGQNDYGRFVYSYTQNIHMVKNDFLYINIKNLIRLYLFGH